PGQEGLPLAFSPDGKRLAGAGFVFTSGEAKVWDAADGRELLTLREPDRRLRAATFGPDGKVLLTLSRAFGTEPGEATLWDAGTGKKLRNWEVGAADAVAVSPDGQYLACADGGSLRDHV